MHPWLAPIYVLVGTDLRPTRLGFVREIEVVHRASLAKRAKRSLNLRNIFLIARPEFPRLARFGASVREAAFESERGLT